MQNQRPSTIHDSRYKDTIEVLIQARKAAGLSQSDLANKLGFTQPDISKIERLERRLDISELLDMMHIFSNGNKTKFDQIWSKINECHCERTTS